MYCRTSNNPTTGGLKQQVICSWFSSLAVWSVLSWVGSLCSMCCSLSAFIHLQSVDRLFAALAGTTWWGPDRHVVSPSKRLHWACSQGGSVLKREEGKWWGWGSELHNVIPTVVSWLEQVVRPDQDPGACKWLLSSQGLKPPHQNLNQGLFHTNPGSFLYIMLFPNLSSPDLITSCLKWRQFDSISICRRPGVQLSRCTDGLLPPAFSRAAPMILFLFWLYVQFHIYQECPKM